MTERPVREKNTAVIRVYIDLEQREDKGQVEREQHRSKETKSPCKNKRKGESSQGDEGDNERKKVKTRQKIKKKERITKDVRYKN